MRFNVTATSIMNGRSDISKEDLFDLLSSEFGGRVSIYEDDLMIEVGSIKQLLKFLDLNIMLSDGILIRKNDEGEYVIEIYDDLRE